MADKKLKNSKENEHSEEKIKDEKNDEDFALKTFKTLENYNTIFFYSKNYPLTTELSRYAVSGSITVDLSIHPEFEKTIKDHYGINKLPCILSDKVNEETGEIYKKVTYVDEVLIENSKIEQENKYIGSKSRNMFTEDEKKAFKAVTEKKLKSILNENSITMFIKGTPSRPECGFTRQLINLIENYSTDSQMVQYNYFNVFEDEQIRNGLKFINDWPTIPQIYFGYEFIGGLDVLRDMKDEGLLDKAIQKYIKSI